MSQSCTVFSAAVGYDEVLSAVRAAAPEAEIAIEGEPSRWHRIRLSTPGASLKMTVMQRETRGDPFSRMILGLHNHLRVAASAVGMVAEPTMDEEEWLIYCPAMA